MSPTIRGILKGEWSITSSGSQWIRSVFSEPLTNLKGLQLHLQNNTFSFPVFFLFQGTHYEITREQSERKNQLLHGLEHIGVMSGVFNTPSSVILGFSTLPSGWSRHKIWEDTVISFSEQVVWLQQRKKWVVYLCLKIVVKDEIKNQLFSPQTFSAKELDKLTVKSSFIFFVLTRDTSKSVSPHTLLTLFCNAEISKNYVVFNSCEAFKE